MHRGAWWATVHGVQRVRHDLSAENKHSKKVDWTGLEEREAGGWGRSISWERKPMGGRLRAAEVFEP